jgi:hypothetical protein
MLTLLQHAACGFDGIFRFFHASKHAAESPGKKEKYSRKKQAMGAAR